MNDMEKQTIVVSGRDGQVGSELRDIAGQYLDFDFHFLNRVEMDITDSARVQRVFEELKPSYFINTAAYTAVDKAETEQELAYRINAEGVGNLATLCKQMNTGFIHISTDYVFDGTSRSPYVETDETKPLNYYGYSKREGERLALANYADTIIVRTSWVYSAYGNNFVKTMLRLMKERTDINVVGDQIGSPTYAKDIAKAIMAIVSKSETKTFPGIYHFSNDGAISWYAFALAIRAMKKLSCNVHPIPTSGYPTPAKRPSYTVMNKDKIVKTFGIQLKDWKESLLECLMELPIG